MATGVPKKNNPRKRSTGVERSSAEALLDLRYPGKRPTEEVLDAPPAEVSTVWAGSEANRLYFAENLGLLALLANDPDVAGHVTLAYIDPPFATETVFHSRSMDPAYEDTLAGAGYVEFLRQRLILLHRLLSDQGSLYVHLDDKMVFNVKVVLDEVFGSAGFRNCITRVKSNPKNYTKRQYGNVSDYILFYAKTPSNVWNRPTQPWTKDRDKEYRYLDPETGRRFMKVPVHAPGVRHGETGEPWRGKLPPRGKHWQYQPRILDEMDARGELVWSANGNPRRKVFLDESSGIGVQDVWTEFRDSQNQQARITGYPTEKNLGLLQRIIRASSNEGELVLDCFSGSGTTLVAASMLGRRWIGVDLSPQAIRHTLRRFQFGSAPMGDFVETRRRPEHQLEMAALIGEVAPGLAKEPGHRSITDFTLYADRSTLHEASTIARDWGLLAPGSQGAASAQRFSIAIERLREGDSVLGSLIDSVGPCGLEPNPDLFGSLIRSIVGQQLSRGAASSISERLKSLFKSGTLSAAEFQQVSDSRLRSAGVSARKIVAMRDLTTRVVEDSLNLDGLSSLSDEEVADRLIAVKGVGTWTAQMFLIFALARPDVFPAGDGAVAAAVKTLYALSRNPSTSDLERISERWRPYRSIATWYLYRYLDGGAAPWS